MVGEKAQDATSHPGDHRRVDSDQPVPGSEDRDELVLDHLAGEFPVHRFRLLGLPAVEGSGRLYQAPATSP
jgi:hypothetical protein